MVLRLFSNTKGTSTPWRNDRYQVSDRERQGESAMPHERKQGHAKKLMEACESLQRLT